MSLRKRLLAGLLTLTVLLPILGSCSGTEFVSPTDVVTQTVTPKGKIPVTVMVKYAFSINAFEKAAEEKFPNLDLIQVGNYSGDRGLIEYASRLEHDDLTDIVMTWPLDIGEEYWEDRLIDLSGMSFTSKYNTSMLNTISKDGKLYYLPGPAQVRGIVYNKTLFAEKGWEVPRNFDEFASLCQAIEGDGIRSIQLPFANSEVLDTAFVGYSYADCFSKPQDARWIADYNNGIGGFEDHFSPALDTFQKMTDLGIWKKEDLTISYAQREDMLFTRQTAMVEDSVLVARMGPAYNGCTDEFGLMPFFNPTSDGSDSDWARLYMVCYIGLNKHLAEPENKEKYSLVLELMDYISTPAGQEALSADTGAMYSSVKGVDPPDIPEIEDLVPALKHGRYAIFPELKNAQSALRQSLAGMLDGSLTREQAVALIDKQNLSPDTLQSNVPLGTAADDFTLLETASYLTDQMRKQAGTDIALFLDNGKDGMYNGKGLNGRFYKGPLTQDDVFRVFPDLKHGEAGVLQKVTMTGETLIKTLEYTIPIDNDKTGWFYYFSGLKMEYAPAAEPGNRIKKITDSDGKAIDPQKNYTIAFMDGSYPEEGILSWEDTGISIIKLLAESIQADRTISPSKDNRFVIANP